MSPAEGLSEREKEDLLNLLIAEDDRRKVMDALVSAMPKSISAESYAAECAARRKHLLELRRPAVTPPPREKIVW